MREILFRGKCKYRETDEWFYGSFANTDDGAYIIDYAREVDPATVGQYTGLTDTNGKRIFEGDVLSGLFLFGMEVNGICEFHNGSFGLEWERGEVIEFTPFTSTCNLEFEVIGNIHDNPELMEGVE